MTSKPVMSERPPRSTNRAAVVAVVCSAAAAVAFFARLTAGAFGDLVLVVGIICTAAAVASLCGWLASESSRTASRFLRVLETIRSYLADEPASFESSEASQRR
jgi:hypothetical protein